MTGMDRLQNILAINCGSSSLKYALFRDDEAVVRGSIAVGAGGASDHAVAVRAVFDQMGHQGLGQPDAVGHRLVHGGPHHDAPERVTDRLLASLKDSVPFAPL